MVNRTWLASVRCKIYLGAIFHRVGTDGFVVRILTAMEKCVRDLMPHLWAGTSAGVEELQQRTQPAYQSINHGVRTRAGDWDETVRLLKLHFRLEDVRAILGLQKKSRKDLCLCGSKAHPAGVEPATFGSVDRCSIH